LDQVSFADKIQLQQVTPVRVSEEMIMRVEPLLKKKIVSTMEAVPEVLEPHADGEHTPAMQ
jgi:hypothetical protein